MTEHDLALLCTIIDTALNGIWLGSFITYILMSGIEDQNPRVMLIFWIIGIVLCYPSWVPGIIIDSIMALWALYDIYKADRTELEEMLEEIRNK